MTAKIFVLPVLLMLSALSGRENRVKDDNTQLEFKCQVVSRSKDKLLVETELINNKDESIAILTMSCDSLIVDTVTSKSWN